MDDAHLTCRQFRVAPTSGHRRDSRLRGALSLVHVYMVDVCGEGPMMSTTLHRRTRW